MSTQVSSFSFNDISVTASDVFVTNNTTTSLMLENFEMLNDTYKKIEEPNEGWLKGILEYLTTWLSYQEVESIELLNKEIEDKTEVSNSAQQKYESNHVSHYDSLWTEWEWIVSKTEELANRRCEQGSEALRKELHELRERANRLKMKPRFAEEAKSTLEQISSSDRLRLQETILDSSKRSKIITDVVVAFSKLWLEYIQRTIFKKRADRVNESQLYGLYEESFAESTYKKGVIGSLKEVGWSASHGNGKVGMTFMVLGDILWSFWNTLCFSLSSILERELTVEEQEGIAERVCDCKSSLVSLWTTTIKTSMLGTSMAGIVVKKWAEADKKEKERIEKIKSEGVSARYEYKRTEVSALERKPIGELKKMLESQLTFY